MAGQEAPQQKFVSGSKFLERGKYLLRLVFRCLPLFDIRRFATKKRNCNKQKNGRFKKREMAVSASKVYSLSAHFWINIYPWGEGPGLTCSTKSQ